MKISEIIKVLEDKLKENGDISVVVYVPGDDVGYWEIEKEKQFSIDEYGNGGNFLKLVIY